MTVVQAADVKRTFASPWYCIPQSSMPHFISLWSLHLIQMNLPYFHIKLSPEKCFGPACGATNVILWGLVTQCIWQAEGKDSIPAKPPQLSGQRELRSVLQGALLLKGTPTPPPPTPDCLLSEVKVAIMTQNRLCLPWWLGKPLHSVVLFTISYNIYSIYIFTSFNTGYS